MKLVFSASLDDKKKTLLRLQWVVALAASYLLLFKKGEVIQDPLALGLIFRVPFLFGVSLLYGYLAEQTRKQRTRAEKAEDTERIKRQLISALAHDIKNPLGVMMGYAEAVQAGLQGAVAKDMLDMLDRIQDNGQRIVKLVTGFRR